MKRAIAIALVILLAGMGANASSVAPQFNDILFENGKDALWLIASGDYDLALALLDFKESAPSVQDFSTYIQTNFLSISDGLIQYEVAVAYYDGAIWTLAIPLLEPKDETVETFLLFSEDGERFTGCGYMLWGDVEMQLEALYDVIWNVEYCPDNTLILTDDTF